MYFIVLLLNCTTFNHSRQSHCPITLRDLVTARTKRKHKWNANDSFITIRVQSVSHSGMLSCLRGKKPFKRRHWQRCHIIHPQIASGDTYREAVGLRAEKKPALETLGIQALRLASQCGKAGLYII